MIAEQVDVLRAGDPSRLDRANLIEHLTDIAKRECRELESRLIALAMHILKCRLQPPPTRSWRLTILEQQRMVAAMLDDYPSLAAQSDGLLRDAYPRVLSAAVVETGVSRNLIPTDVPTVQDLLTFDASRDA